MQTAGHSSRADGRPVNIPKLSYRNSAQIDPSQLSTREPTVTAPKSPTGTGSTHTWQTPPSPRPPPSTAASSQSSRLPQSKYTLPSPQNQKRKSIFGGLFVKEPTGAALEKVAAQLIAQHGELSARAVPGVSSQKLPNFVPKVNSKWDGIPEALKEREKAEKDRVRQAKRSSNVPTVRSRSAGGSRDSHPRQHDRRSREQRNSNSTLSSFDSRGRANYQHLSQGGSSDDRCSASQTSTSHGAGNLKLEKAFSTRSQSLRSPSGTSLPEITAFFPDDIPAQPALPARFRNEPRTDKMSAQKTPSTNTSHPNQNFPSMEAQVDAVPEHTCSPVTTPRERSPVTPSPHISNQLSAELNSGLAWKGRDDAIFVSSGADVLGPPATATMRRKTKAPGAAFLAGEARPLELPDDVPEPPIREQGVDLNLRRQRTKSFGKPGAPVLSASARIQRDLENRPDSSRARLGLRASMIVNADQTPWVEQGRVYEAESGSPGPGPGPGPRPSAQAGSKKMLGLGMFGKDKESR